MKPPLFIKDERWADRILCIILFGGFLGIMLWALLTQMHTEPDTTMVAVIVYYGMIVVCSLLLVVVLWKNSLFRAYAIDELQIAESTSFWKLMQWRKCYPCQEVSSVKVASWRSGFPVTHAWYWVHLRFANGKVWMLPESRDRQKIETLTDQIKEVWSRK
jgi:hypothetical protein